MGRSRRRRPAVEMRVVERANVPYPVQDTESGPPFASSGAQQSHPDTPLLGIDPGEYSMLGENAPLARWLARIARGRGATVCTAGALSHVTEVGTEATPSFQCCLDAPDGCAVPLMLRGRHAIALHQALGRHAASTPIYVFVSGYGAELQRLPKDPPRAGVVWAEQFALKALVETADAGPLTLWFESDRTRPATVVVQPADAPKPTLCSDAWFGSCADADEAPPAPADTRPTTASPERTHPPTECDQLTYTPLHEIHAGQLANVMGVLVEPPTVRGTDKGADAMVRVYLRAPTQPGAPGTVVPANLFARQLDQLPHHARAGDAILLRHIQCKEFLGRVVCVGPAFRPYSWALCSHGTFTQLPGTHIGPEEAAALTQLTQSSEPRAPAPLPTIAELRAGTTADLVVELVAVHLGRHVPDLYVTDYSCNEALQQNDEHLQRRFGRDEASCRGRVFHVGLWGEQGALALRLHAGQFVRLGRVHVRAHTWQGLLGAMGSQSRQSDTITILDERDALLAPLLQRRRSWMTQRAAQKRSASPVAAPPPARMRTASPSAHAAPESDEPGALPPASLFPVAAMEPVQAPRYALDSDDMISVRDMLDGELPSEADVAGCVLRLAPDTDWRRTWCRRCDVLYVPTTYASLPREHRFCVQCADEDGKHLCPELAFSLDICDPRDAPRTQRGAQHVPALTVSVRGAAAEPLLRCSAHAYLHSSAQRARAHQVALALTAAPAAHVLHMRVRWACGAYVLVASRR